MIPNPADSGDAGPLLQCLSLFPGIGPAKERSLRQAGVVDWYDLQGSISSTKGFGSVARGLEEAFAALAARDVRYFARRLPSRLRYLACLAFPEKVTYLDIESTGLSKVYHSITIIGWQKAGLYQYEILGREREPSDSFVEALQAAPLVVTFNGALFDLPFIKTAIEMPEVVSVDLRFLAHRLGLTGTLKELEAQLGLERPETMRGMVGERAPALWFRATRGDRAALQLLIEYNYFDVTNLSVLLHELAAQALGLDGFAVADSRYVSLVGGSEPHSQPTVEELDLALAMIARDALPRLTYDPHLAERGPVVVGIDLTGSEARASGVAILRGNAVDCSLVKTDDELVELVTRTQPDVVSIDAPLSLPSGRTSTADDDPERASAGILRWSERELLRRGVKLYACLLPSMQGLTSRGMGLAKRMREAGIACIESFPGAAQDMLAMPRKGVGLEHLRLATEQVGLRLPDRNISHDELDAVTSAIVGALFLDGRYEALGTADEEPMIVPSVARRNQRHIVVVISGRIGAGKTTAARMLEELGYAYGRYSQVLLDEDEGAPGAATRSRLQAQGMALHESGRQRRLGARLIAQLEDSPLIVVDGARWPEDLATMRERFGLGVLHLHIDAARRTRLARSKLPEGYFDAADRHPVEGGVDRVAAMADLHLANEGSIDELREMLVKLASRLSSDAAGSIFERNIASAPARSGSSEGQ